MSFMFKFNIFSITHWHRLAHTHLHGFPGFVFGILILAMIPLYIATSTLIIRKNQPLITIPLPKIKPSPAPQTADTTDTSDAPAPDTDTPELSDDVPDEMRHIFARASRNLERFAAYNRTNTTAPQTQNDTSTPDAPVHTENDLDLPIPTDFDITLDDTPDMFTNAPTWTDISFDTPNTDEPKSTPNEKLAQHLTAHGTEFSIQDDVFITPTHAIIAHSDPDFWVTDDDNWFATGKSRPSPIKTVVSVAQSHNLTPVIYLDATNILDIETLIPQWESDGIIVITDINKI